MSVDFKKLSSFVKIVDTGSMSRAANTLRIAQPALSQQVAALEAHFKQKLLLRSNHGVAPTEAGFTLYRHAQAMLKQLEQSQRDVTKATTSLQGHVSIGLATFSGAANFAGPLLLALADKHPDIVLNISDSFGHVLSELVISGRLDMALIYSFGAIKGTRLQPLFREEFFLVAPRSLKLPGRPNDPVELAALQGIKMLLPSSYHFLRKLIEASFAHVRIAPRVAAEIEVPDDDARRVGCRAWPDHPAKFGRGTVPGVREPGDAPPHPTRHLRNDLALPIRSSAAFRGGTGCSRDRPENGGGLRSCGGHAACERSGRPKAQLTSRSAISICYDGRMRSKKPAVDRSF